jgi:hypothetical protein
MSYHTIGLLFLLLGLAMEALAQNVVTSGLCKYGQLPGRWVDAPPREDGKEVPYFLHALCQVREALNLRHALETQSICLRIQTPYKDLFQEAQAAQAERLVALRTIPSFILLCRCRISPRARSRSGMCLMSAAACRR